MTRLLGVIGVVALVFAGMVWAGEAGYGYGHGMMRGHGYGNGQGRGMMHRNFTDRDDDGDCDHDGAGMMRNRHYRGGCRFARTQDCDEVQGKTIDKDGDGQCDFAPRHQNCPFAETKGDKDTPHQRRFIDKDGDGVCDYHKTVTDTKKVTPKVEPKTETK